MVTTQPWYAWYFLRMYCTDPQALVFMFNEASSYVKVINRFQRVWCTHWQAGGSTCVRVRLLGM